MAGKCLSGPIILYPKGTPKRSVNQKLFLTKVGDFNPDFATH